MTEQTPEPTWATAQPPEDVVLERTFAEGPGPDETPEEPRTLGEWPEETVEQIRAAEAAAQRSVCNIPDGEYPDDLDRALERRVEVNLAQYDGGPIVRVGSADPEVRELEAPYSKRSAREA
jgi:hypothetical protein